MSLENSKKQELLEDEPWYDINQLCNMAKIRDPFIGGIEHLVIPSRNGGVAHNMCYVLRVSESDNPHDDYRFFLSRNEAVAARVIRGLEPPTMTRTNAAFGAKIFQHKSFVKIKNMI